MHRPDLRNAPPFARILAAVLLPLLLVACGGPSGGGGGGDATCGDRIGGTGLASSAVGFAGNNNAVLTGSAYGGNSASESALRCTVPLDVSGDASGFVFGEATVMRRRTTSEGVYLTVPVRNDGAARCFVRFNDTALLGRSGNVLESEESDFAQGSLARLASGVYTDTCLDEGETGYLFNIFLSDTLFANVARVRIGSVEGDTGMTAPALSVQPQSYQVAAGGGSLAVTVRNEGSGTAVLGEFSLYIRLDADGDPYGWTFFDDPTTSELAPGTSTVYSDAVTYDGTATGMHAYIDAVPPDGATLRAAAGERTAAPADPLERRRLRTARIAAQHAAFSAWLERGR